MSGQTEFGALAGLGSDADVRSLTFREAKPRRSPRSNIPYRTALIVGAGSGISASVARGLAAAGIKVGLAARTIDKLAPLATEIGAERFAADASLALNTVPGFAE